MLQKVSGYTSFIALHLRACLVSGLMCALVCEWLYLSAFCGPISLLVGCVLQDVRFCASLHMWAHLICGWMYATDGQWLCPCIHKPTSLLVGCVLQTVSECTSMHIGVHISSDLMCGTDTACKWLFSCICGQSHLWLNICCRW